MTEKKTEELKETDLDHVQGGNFVIQDLMSGVKKAPKRRPGNIKKPDAKPMEWVHEDE